MRKIPLPDINDLENLQLLELSVSDHARAIAARFPAISERFAEYDRGCGSPWVVDIDEQFTDLQAQLRHLYSSPPVCLGFIANLRYSLAGACPVCGGRGVGTLDHYLPKSNYAEFSFYSKNLVPACFNCNTHRGDLTKGQRDPERPIHPYFDVFVERRVMTIVVSPPWEAPKVKAIPFNVTGNELITAKWHIENIIIPTGFDREIRHIWSAIRQKPSTFFKNNSNVAMIISQLNKWREIEEASDNSMNGWRSCFIHGLSRNSAALEYISTLLLLNPANLATQNI